MSANNLILITKKKKLFIIDDCDMESGKSMIKIGKAKTLDEAVKIANRYAEDNEVEYGISCKI